jgi:hypothetical protein
MGVIMSEQLEENKAEEVGYKEVSGREIEQQLIEENEKKFEDPVEMASMMFSMYLPTFKKKLELLNHGAKARLINYLVEYPIGKDYIPNTELEQEIWFLGRSLIECKFVMVMSTYKDSMEEIMGLKALEGVDITTETTIESQGEVNE